MPDILFSINPSDGQPIYRQIVEQVKAAVASGRLRPGDRLPTHRDLAREVVVAPLTVKKAYDSLEGEGLIRQEQGRGTFVAGSPGEAAPGARAELAARVEALVRQARLLGLGEEEVLRMVGRRWNRRRARGRARR